MDHLMIEKMAREKGMSPFEVFLRTLPVAVCDVFRRGPGICPSAFKETGQTLSSSDADIVRAQFPNTTASHGNHVLEASKAKEDAPLQFGKKVLVLFSGGPASGGNNIIVGLYKALGPQNHLYGVKAGPGGLLMGDTFEITGGDVRRIFDDLLQFERVKEVCRNQGIDAIVIVGGDDSNTNAAFLAEHLFHKVHPDGRGVQVIGVPKTIDGDLQVKGLLPISFGFDTATKIYSAIVGNIAQDTPSSRKYYHFIKIMGRSASHVTLAVAQRARPSMTFISEEVAHRGLSLDKLVEGIAYTVARRAACGIQHGVVLIPEGLIEFIPECRKLISELNKIIDQHKNEMAHMPAGHRKEFIHEGLSKASQKVLDSLPEEFRNTLLLDRDEHGNLPLSKIQTEKLFMQLVSTKISQMQNHPAAYDFIFKKFSSDEFEAFKKFKFVPLPHFLGYEGRCGAPSKFDQAFTLNLGLCAGSLILAGKTGYLASVTDLDKGGRPVAIPLTGLLNVEQRGAQEKIVIKKALVELDSPAFKALKEFRKYWAIGDYFHSTGPRQYYGPKAVTDTMPLTVMLNQEYTRCVFNLGEEISIFPSEND